MAHSEPQADPAGEEENAAKATSPQSAEPRLSVIGIGASAGGLAALRAFFAALPADSGMTFVVVVHLSPEHESVLAELLQAHTGMPVAQVTQRVEMQPNHVYVIPPGKRLLVREDALELVDFDMPLGRRLRIDTFFRSLAEHHGDGGAVILSGTGSDGSVGIRSIKEGGGLILVQDPEEAEFDSMPKSAIATGLVDIVGPAPALAAQLVAAKRTGAGLELPANPADLTAAAEGTLMQILAHLRLRTGHDFNGYKRGTLLRRIGRRMALAQLQPLTAYLQRLREDGEEADALHRDLLIHVTEFFRDPEAWETLAEAVIPQIFAGKGRHDNVRVWTVGCATGEETYGLAMLLLEHAATLDQPPGIQVFASDLGKVALDFARQGVYPEAIAANVSEERLARFFVKDNSHYRVKDDLRDLVLFAPHNLLQDPPFSKLDLICCRNLLIYLQREVQARVYESFHYALRPHGYLFLGSAEMAEGAGDLFETVHKAHRLYRRNNVQEGRGYSALVLPRLEGNRPVSAPVRRLPGVDLEEPAQPPRRPPSEREGSAEHWLLLEEVAPPSLLVDEHHQVLHLSETVGRYLQHPGGTISSDVTRLVHPELQGEVRGALARAFVSGRMARSQAVPVGLDGTPRPVSVLVHPNPRQDRALLFFLEEEEGGITPGVAEESESARRRCAGQAQLEAELHHSQQRLQVMQEEHETTVEELRAANEELQSTNEEYRAILEELETSKEELQSMNEELQTVNGEIKTRMEQTTQINSDLQNLLAATEIATLFLDRELRIQRYTPAAVDLFNLMPPDRNRPIGHLRSNLAYDELEADARRVLARLAPFQRDIESDDGRWFQVDVRPYRTLEDHIDGVVITFVDVTANKRNELALAEAKVYAESIVHTIPDALLVLETDLRVRTANDTFYEMFRVRPEATEGELIYELGNSQWDIPELRTLLEEILPENNVFMGYEVEHEFEGVGRRTMLLNGRRLDHVQLILLVITDISERKRAEEARRLALAQQAFLLKLHDALRPLADPVEIEYEAARVLGEHLGADRAYYVEIDEARGKFVVAQEWRQPGAPSHARRYPLADWPMPWLSNGETWVVRDVASDPALPDEQRASYRGNDIGAAIVVPLINEQRLVATLVVNQSTPRAWAPEEIALVEETAERTWAVVRRAGAEEALAESEAKYRTLFEAMDEGFCIIEVLFDDEDRPVDYRFLETNPALTRQSGLQDAEGKRMRELEPQHEEHWFETYGRIALSGEPERFVSEAKHLGRWFDVYAFRIGQPEEHRVAVLFKDITAQRQMNEQLEAKVQERTAQVRSLVTQLTLSEQTERRRISQLLHDDLQQHLYGVQFQLESLRNSLGDAQRARAQARIDDIETVLQTAVQTTRTLSVDLSPPVLYDEGLVGAVRWLANQMADLHGLSVALQATDDVPVPGEDLRVLLFQIVRELLFNVVKHAGVLEAAVALSRTGGHIRVEVSDQGQGFAPAAIPDDGTHSYGLSHSRQRLALVGGSLHIESVPGDGARIVIECPLTDQSG